MKESRFERLCPYPAVIVLLVLFLAPLACTLGQAFIRDGRPSLGTLAEVFLSPYNQKILLFTFKQALVSTVCSLLLGLPGAWILGRFEFRGKLMLKSVCAIPFVLPPILVVLGFVIFYGNSGFLNRILMAAFRLERPPLRLLYSFEAIILAHSFYNFPVAMNLIGTSWARLDPSCAQAARTLGAGRARTFLRITLPSLLPSILSSAMLIFLFCFTSFAVVLVLGGGPRFTTIEVEIYNKARRAADIGGAAALSLASAAVCLAVLLLNTALQRRAAAERRVGSSLAPLRRLRGPAKAFVLVYCVLLLLFVAAPQVSIVVRSLWASASRSGPRHLSLDLYRQIFQGGSWRAALNSLAIGLAASLLAVGLGTPLCLWIQRRGKTVLETLCMLPMAISTVIIGLGYLVVRRLLGGGRAFLLVVLAHLVITLPFVVRTIMPVWRALPENLAKASRTLGAGALRTLAAVELPLLRPAILTAMCFAFAISSGEMNATLVLSSNTIETIPLAIYRMINSYNFQGACALGTILIAVCLAVFAITEAAQRRRSHV